MKNKYLFIATIFLFPLLATAERAMPDAAIAKLSNWEPHEQEADGQFLIEFIPKGENIDNWKSIMTTSYISYQHISKFTSLKRFVDGMIYAGARTACQSRGGKFTQEILKQSSKDITFRWSIRGCGRGMLADQTQVQRVLKGVEGFHTFGYGVKSPGDTPAKEAHMLKVVDSVTLL